ncbi:MAG: glycoside hydrolase family 5 protein [Armatimonadota bacterium]|nr:glycoside hydrolase family 5 protein [Armatimonadota bacterium]
MMLKSYKILAAIVVSALLAGWPPALAAAPPDESLVSNGNFEADENADNWPDNWGPIKEGTWEKEGDNHFLRLTSPEPDKMVLTYLPVNIPAGTKALELSWRWRISDLKKGKQSWFDARIMLDFRDAINGNKLKGAPGAPSTGKSTDGWVEKSIKFLVPEGAKILEFMPTLFQVEKGTFDLDDVVIKPTDAAPLEEAAQAKAAADKAKQEKAATARQTKAAAELEKIGSLFSNGDFETDKKGDGWPDDWGGLKDGSYEVENGNHFLRMKSSTPGKLVSIYREVTIPAGVKALELTWKQRISDLKPGKAAWFDARIMMNFKDAAGQKMSGGPPAPYTRRNTEGWVERSVKFLVPEGAVSLEFMPALFEVESGTYDLDDIVLKPTDPAVLEAAAVKAAEEAKYVNVPPEAPQPDKWPPELHVEGNKVLAKDGKEVWLQGLNVVSLEWNPRGERILRNALVALEDWKANIIRLPVKESYWFGKDPGQKDGGAEYRELVDSFITIVANRGAYVLLDLHRYRAPRREHVEFWTDAATRYKNHPAVLFDLFNEPHGTSWEVWRNGGFVEDQNAPADEDAFLTPEEKALNKKGFHAVGMQALVDAVRGTGAKNIVAAGGLDWAYDLSGIANGFALDDKGGNGIIYSTHIYAGKRDWPGKVLLIADKYPIIVGEVGANTKKFTFIPAEAQEDAATWVPRVLGFIQQHKLHWTAFSFHPGAAPVMITGWDYTPTPEWGALVKRALAGEQFPPPQELR